MGRLVKNVKLSNDPLLEALFEVRFEPIDDDASNMFTGLIYSHIRDEFPKVETQNITHLPAEIRKQDPNIRYSAEQRFKSDAGYLVSAGARVLTISVVRPYQHWEQFKPQILSKIELLNGLDYVGRVERLGMRYINFIVHQGAESEQFAQIKFSGELAGFDLTGYQTQFKTEIPEKEYLRLITIGCNATNAHPDFQEKHGLLLDIDTIRHDVPENFLSSPESILEEMHDIVGETFFSSLTDETIKRLQ